MKFLFLSVGKPKHRFYQEGIQHYLEQISHLAEIESVELKDHAENKEKEEKALLEYLDRKKYLEGRNRIFLLDDGGKKYRSEEFAHHLRDLESQGVQKFVFLVGGAYGFSAEMKKKFVGLSLSSFLFPHDLAKLVLFEQVYRALHILRGGKYHHEE